MSTLASTPASPLASPPASESAACAAGTPRLKRFLDDLGMSVVLSAWAAVLITLVDGRPAELYPQLVYSICIGLVAVTVIDGARLRLLGDPARRAPRALPLVALVVLSAPLSHYTGIVLGSAILGNGPVSLAAYPNAPQLRMIVFTLLGISATFLIILNRERMQRIQAERAEARARAEAVERQAAQAQLRLLQAQIEPHMLFNTLANLQGLIALDPARAGRMLDQLIQYLRATLGATRAENTTLAEEFGAIEAYLGLMAVRMGPRLACRCRLPQALRTARLPAMLLQPLVENAILHGLEPHVDGGTVSVEAAAHGGMLEIVVRDDGLGLDAGRTPADSDAGSAGDNGSAVGNGGIGLATTRERLRALYGGRAALVLEPGVRDGLPCGAVARLTLPLEDA
ncbi:histidine kinase [Massilia forsythiae]|uniref:Histidine kinase n=1 Tax=Massilia forsythiae TaxID=2728020 RepID=A0A7Z2ZUY8_9BURK|nr:histidine kinase [Massilia forsythiae]QJE02800.1 histidine kinase [Massilia forsythiae]